MPVPPPVCVLLPIWTLELVPEPSTALLLGLGLTALAASKNRGDHG